jgi:hypothetical protein
MRACAHAGRTDPLSERVSSHLCLSCHQCITLVPDPPSMYARGSNSTLAPTGATGTIQLTQVRVLDIQELANPATVTYAGG